MVHVGSIPTGRTIHNITGTTIMDYETIVIIIVWVHGIAVGVYIKNMVTELRKRKGDDL